MSKSRSDQKKDRPDQSDGGKAKSDSASKRARARPVRVEPGSEPAGEVGQVAELSQLGALFAAFDREGIQFLVIGMTAAILQGAPGMTLDTDLWLNLGQRQYMRPINIALRLGLTQIRPTVIASKNDKLIDLCYSIDGVDSFAIEYERAKVLVFEGVQVRVLELGQVIRSKEASNRPKDIATLPFLKDVAEGRKELRIRDDVREYRAKSRS